MRWLQVLLALIEVPVGTGERRVLSRLVRLQLAYSLAGLTLGLICVVGGILLFFHGVSGSTSWVGHVIGLQGGLSDAAPGTVLFVVGLLIVWITRFDVRVRRESRRLRRQREPDRP
jgi:uncharacterized membrane protein